MRYELDGVGPDLSEDVYIADTASVIGKVRLEAGASVWPQAVLRGDNEWITVGEGANVQDGSVLHTDPGAPLTIGRNVTIGHMVMLHGCVIGDNSLIGIGSIVLNNARIGENCMIGANSLITEGKEIPSGVLALGAPARVVRPLTDQEIAIIEASAHHYRDNGRRYRDGLRPID